MQFVTPTISGRSGWGVCLIPVLVWAATAAGCGPSEPRASATGRIALAACEVAGYRGDALCGTYDVWENRAARSGRQIALQIVVVPAREPARAPDPVFYLAGGPGGSAIDVVGPISRELATVNETRDLVFVDVRGTGRSGELQCAPIPDDAPLQRYFQVFFEDSYVRECLAAQKADVRFYTEPLAVDDLDDVRQRLGYERINLYGSSGGTRAALLYLRRHSTPVRTLVLHGAHPMNGRMPLAYSRGLDDAVRSLTDGCALDSSCRAQHPDLGEAWTRLQARFAEGSIEADVLDPRTYRRERVKIERGVFAEGLRQLFYDFRAADLPEIIDSASRGDFDRFTRRLIARTHAMHRAVAKGMFLTATCAEDVRFITEDDVVRETGGTFLGDYRVRRQQAACRIWPRGEGVDDNFLQPVRSDVPVLLLSGDADVATPAERAEQLTRDLPNSRHVVFSRQGHAPANFACTSTLIAAFVGSASVSGLDASCAGQR